MNSTKKRSATVLFLLVVLLASAALSQAVSEGQPFTVVGRPLVVATTSGNTLYGLLTEDYTVYNLVLTPELESLFVSYMQNTQVEVRGNLVASTRTIDVTSIIPLGQPSALDLGTLDEQPTVALLVQFSGDAYMPQMPVYFVDMVFDGSSSAKRFWQQNSYNRFRIVKGGAYGLGSYGWFPLPKTLADYIRRSNGDPIAFWLDIAIDATNVIPPTSDQRIIIFMNREPPSPFNGGAALRGIFLRTLNGRMVSLMWAPPSAQNARTVDEIFGSNIGFFPSGTVRYVRNSPYDIQSIGSGHTNVFNKIGAQWLQMGSGFSIIPLGSSPQVVPLYPTTDSLATHMKAIIIGDSTELKAIEYRKRVGFDSNLPVEGMVVHQSFRSINDWVYLLSRVPGSPNNAPFTLGQSFIDPHRNMGVKFKAIRPDGGINVLVAPVLNTESLGAQGTFCVGCRVQFAIASQISSGLSYMLLASFSSNGPFIQLPDGRALPLALNQLLLFSIAYPSLIGLANSQGVLDNNGEAIATLDIPNKPALRGLAIDLAYVTFDPATNAIAAISRPLHASIV